MSLPAAPPVDVPIPELELSARMLNEFIYCPRLFYYEYVDGVFVHNVDTLGGSRVHQRVNGGTGNCRPPSWTAKPPPIPRRRKNTGAASFFTATVDGANASIPNEEAALSAARERGEIIHSRSVWLSSVRLDLNANPGMRSTPYSP